MSMLSKFLTAAEAATHVAAALLVPTAPAFAGAVAPITNLDVTDKTASSVTLTWSVPSDTRELADCLVGYPPAQLTWQTFVHAVSTDTTITSAALRSKRSHVTDSVCV